MVNKILQNPRDCVYGFFTNDAVLTFQADKLLILRDGRLQIPSLSIQVYAAIIGESHFAQIYLGEKLLAIELLACVNLGKIGFKPNFHHSFKESSRLQQKIKIENGNTKIQIEATLYPPTSNRNRKQFVPAVPQNGLYIIKEFPGAKKPRTVVAVKVEGKMIEIQTLHEYVLGQKIEPLISWTRIFYWG